MRPVEITDILQQRERRYGDFRDQAHFACSFKDLARTAAGWSTMTEYQREGLDMILHKIARALSGDPAYIDTWVDIEGYAKLVVDRMAQDEARGARENT
jgi:hypothetical protein